MKEIKLNKIEYNYLSKAKFLPNNWQNLPSVSWKQSGHDYLLIISEDRADEFRDLFGEHLQLVGFNEEYKPTQEGELLESLIDKFFCE